MTEYYDLLGISKNATAEEIKKAYRKQALKHHPDRNQNNKEESEKKFKEIGEAHKVLSDPNLKKRYDQFGKAGLEGNPDISNFNPFDMFSGMGGMGGMGGFANMFMNKGNGMRQEVKLVPPQEFVLKTELNILYTGATKQIKVNKMNKCDLCNGKGGKNPNSETKCKTCKGKGQVIKVNKMGPNFITQSVQTCDKCCGKGKYIKKGEECMKCNGQKYINGIDNIEFTIKPGSKEGDRIILHGNGDWDPNSGITRDLIIIINEVPGSNGMIRQGQHLLIKIKITLVEALCGFEKIIKHLDGRHILIKNDKIIKPNQKMVVKDEGMNIIDVGLGDLIIEFIINFPETLSSERKKYLKKILPTPKKQIWDIDKNSCDNYSEVEMIPYNGETQYENKQQYNTNVYADSSDSDDDFRGVNFENNQHSRSNSGIDGEKIECAQQ